MSDVGYVRVSSEYQNTERQLDEVKLDKIFTDKTSGVDTQRPQLQAMLEYVKEGDVIHFYKENLTFTNNEDPIKKLMFQLLGSFAEFERSLMVLS